MNFDLSEEHQAFTDSAARFSMGQISAGELERAPLARYCQRRTRGRMIVGASIEILKNRIAVGLFGRTYLQRISKP